MKLIQDIMKELRECDEKVSLVIKDLIKDKWLLKHDENRVFPSASLIKIPIMIEAFYQVNMGKFKLKDKIEVNPEDRIDYSLISELSLVEYPLIDLIVLMIIHSDNTATNVLINLLGIENINNRINFLGCKDTFLRRKMLDFNAAKEGKENLTSPMDMALIMERLYNKSIISPKISENMIHILTRQKHRDMLPRYILEDLTIAHKTGELKGLNHDIGIFYLENNHYLIGIFTTDGKDDLQGKRTIGRISKIVYEGLNKRGDLFEYSRKTGDIK